MAAPEFPAVRILWRRFLAEEDGASMVEYGMMIALIAILVMGALYLLGGSLTTKLNQAATCLTTRVCP
jgi:pilus assembly protein Flp/PilA